MIRFYILSFALIFSFHCGLSAQQVSPDSLMNSGSVFYSNNEYDKAGEDFKQAMKLYLQRKDTISWIGASFQYGSALVEQGFVREGITVFNKVENKKPLSISLSLEARKANLLGWAYEKLEMPDSVKLYLSNGLKLAEQGQDSLQIARISNNLSYYYQNEGDYERAFKLQKKAIQYFTLINDLPRLSAVLNRSFLTMMDLGLYQQAEEYIRQSLVIREELGNPNLLDVAYHNLAWNFERQGKRDSAIIYYQKSLELSRQLGNPYDITQTLDNIGGLYERSGDFENALAYYNESLDINREIERPASTAEGLLRIARVAVQNNDPENATAFYHEALGLLEDTNAPRLLASVYIDLANLEIEEKNYQSSKDYIAKARQLAEEKGFKTRQVRAYNSLAKLHKLEGDSQASLRAYRKAYDLSADNTITSKISPAILLAKAYNEVGSDSAFIFAKEAFSLIDSVRTNVAGLAFRSGFFSQHAGFYNEVASWYVAGDQAERAYDLVESAKARVLMDELAEAENNFLQQLDESTLITKQQMSKQIDQLYNRIDKTEDKGDIQELNDQLKDLEFKYQSFINEIRQSIPEWKNFAYPEPLTSEQVMHFIPENSALLEFAYADQELMIFLITSDEVKSVMIDDISGNYPKEHLTNIISSYRDKIIEQVAVSDLNEISQPLYELLVQQPLSISDETINDLLIIPEGNLTFLPFEALYTGNNYLIEDLNIKYLPSASVYPFIQAPHRTTQFDMLAVAGSGFTENAIGTEVSSQNNYASLPSTLIEVESITRNFNNTKVLKNDDVTEAGLKSHNLSQFRFLHFATHGNIDEVNPSQSGLILSKKTDVESLFGEDGYLNSTEISGLNLNADLVTLSACNTGMGKIISGEGLVGLQRSFLSAGSSAVMVSLWNIYDRSTADFMSEFYNRLKVHEATDYGVMNRTLDWFGFYEHPLFDYKAKALQDAKLSMISHPYYSHPIHWAPFILIGK